MWRSQFLHLLWTNVSRFNLTYLGAAIYQSLCEVVCQSLYKEHSGIPSKKPTSCSPWEVPRLDFQAWYRLEQGAQCFQLGALSFHTSIDWTRNSAGKVNKSNKGRQKSMQKYWRFELINNVTPPGYSPGVKALQKVGTSQLRLADRNKTGGSSCTRNWSLWQIVASSQASQPAAFCAATSWRLHRTLPNHQTESNVFQFSKPPFSFQEQFISSTCRGPTSFRTTMQKPQLQQLGNDTEVPKSSIEVKRSNHVKPALWPSEITLFWQVRRKHSKFSIQKNHWDFGDWAPWNLSVELPLFSITRTITLSVVGMSSKGPPGLPGRMLK